MVQDDFLIFFLRENEYISICQQLSLEVMEMLVEVSCFFKPTNLLPYSLNYSKQCDNCLAVIYDTVSCFFFLQK